MESPSGKFGAGASSEKKMVFFMFHCVPLFVKVNLLGRIFAESFISSPPPIVKHNPSNFMNAVQVNFTSNSSEEGFFNT